LNFWKNGEAAQESGCGPAFAYGWAKVCLHEEAYRQNWGDASFTRSRETLVLTALILVCSLAVTPDLSDCSQSNAVDTMFVPEQFANPATCFMHGQAYLAETSIGRGITQDERVKVVCVRSKSTTVGMSLK
jgi:hypothetical protein